MHLRLHSYILPTEKNLYIHQQLDSFMMEKKPFLQLEYGINQLAESLNIPSYQLSAYINRTLGVNFNEYINRFRVQYCENLIRMGLTYEFNMKGLALKCGFHNRNTFTSAFKKFTGITPSCYQRIWKFTMDSRPALRPRSCQNL